MIEPLSCVKTNFPLAQLLSPLEKKAETEVSFQFANYKIFCEEPQAERYKICMKISCAINFITKANVYRLDIPSKNKYTAKKKISFKMTNFDSKIYDFGSSAERCEHNICLTHPTLLPIFS